MSSIWIILLDTSGSMGDGFAANSGNSADPLAESGAWATKLDAAKELLLRQVSTLRAQDIAIFRFTDSYEKLFHGFRDDLLKTPELINSLEAGGGTSIATALDGVRDDTRVEQYRSISILILTDGLSDRQAATQAANAFVAKYPFARIDTILIDETDQGREVAESVSINGTVRNARSSIQLRAAISESRVNSLRSELSNMALLRYQAQRELSSLQLLAQPTLITVTSDQALTAATLRNDLAPTIAGIESIGRAVSNATGAEYRGSITSISQDSPISINLTGLKETVELVLTYVIPWRRHNAERLCALDLRERELEIERQEHDLSLHDLAAEQRRLEMQLELAKSKWELAEKMLKELDPDSRLRGKSREKALARLLAGIDQLATTRLEFEVIRDFPRH